MDIISMRTRFDGLIDKENFAILADVVGPAERKRPLLVDHSKGLCRFFTGIAQNRIIEFERFCEAPIRIRIVATRSKVGHIECTQLLATLTE